MTDFSNLKSFDVVGKTARYTLSQLGAGANGLKPVLIGRPAAFENAVYRDAMLADVGERFRAAGGRVELSSEALDATRAKARVLYPRYVICGWENVFDASGAPVEFSAEAAAQFVEMLPAWIFDEVRTFFEDARNFASVRADAQVIAGN